MYEALVARVRYHIQKAEFMGLKDAESTCLLKETADAIEALSKLALDEHNRAAIAAWNHRWIPVEKRLPENHQSVLVLRDDGGIFIWEYFDQTPTEECWIDDHLNLYSAYSITHWMPLPEPPKEE